MLNGDERWLPVPGFEDHYSVSSFGRVRSTARGAPRLLKPGIASNGYPTVSLGRRNSQLVHRLVLGAFVGPCPPGQEALHDDGDRENSRLSNLSYGTRSDNIRDAVRHGTWHSEKRIAGWHSPAQLAGLVKARAAQSPENIRAALLRGRETRWGKR